MMTTAQLRVLTWLLALGIFGLDINLSLGVSIPIAYIGVIFLSLRLPGRYETLAAAIVTTILTAIGSFLAMPRGGAEIWKIVVNRGLGVMAVWLTTVVGLDRKRSEDELRASRESLANAQRIARLGSWEWHVPSDRVTWSNEMYRIFGVDRFSYRPTGRSWLEHVHPDDRERCRRAVTRALRDARPFAIEYRIQRDDGEERTVRVDAEGARASDGHVAHMSGTVHDVTEHRQLEGQLAQAQKMEAVGQISGGIAHDFNNLLTAIQGSADLLLEHVCGHPVAERAARRILLAAERGRSLTQRLLAFTRRQIVQEEPLDLNSVVRDTGELLSRVIGTGIEIDLDLEPTLWVVKADRTHMEQVAMNLAINAADAMAEGGRLTLRTSNEILGTEEASSAELPEGEYVCLCVKDTGSGMDAITLSRIFEPFFTTKRPGKGTGLGLSTVQSIVKQSHGGMRVESEAGRGTTFSIYFPRSREVLRVPETPATSAVGQRGAETVLLVEDDNFLRELATEVLEMNGYRLIVAASPDEALVRVLQHTGPIHILVTDVEMPGMTGVDLAAKVKDLKRGVRLLLMSGYTSKSLGDRGVLDDNAAFLQKPFSNRDLLDKVREVLDA
jgi:PAS domain S-box-containing protein